MQSTILAPVAPTYVPVPAMPSVLDDLITCTQCNLVSPFADDADEGAEAAHDAGWHVRPEDREECGCSILCGGCRDAWCGIADYTPRLIGMRAA
ncbi:MAG: hypothetical protein JO362_21770 [Streptomycetaceae bacterium]|nr:hypothetical protein [Streptomycetaceae bacterium]